VLTVSILVKVVKPHRFALSVRKDLLVMLLMASVHVLTITTTTVMDAERVQMDAKHAP